jgi:hypothetical protein
VTELAGNDQRPVSVDFRLEPIGLGESLHNWMGGRFHCRPPSRSGSYMSQ